MDRIPPLSAPLLRGTLTRRTFFRGAGAVALGSALAACGTEGTATTPGAGRVGAGERRAAAQDLSDTEKVVNWSNWPEYIDLDEDAGTMPTLLAFTKASGIEVEYTEDYNDNDEFFAKVKAQLQSGQDTGRDVWCSTDWMVARLIRLGWVQQLDKANIPNAANLEPDLQQVPFDAGRALLAALAERASPASPTTPTRPAGRRSSRSTSC